MLAIVPQAKRPKLTSLETTIPEVKIAFALSLEDGSVVTAASQRGRDTPIPARCIVCDQILCFRKGHYRKEFWVNGHFAHKSGTLNHGESDIHKIAKRILATTPFTFYEDCTCHYSQFCENKICQTFRPTHSKEEYGFKQFFVDVALLHNDGVMAYVEVKHTHWIPDEKMNSFRAHSVPWFEVSAQDVCDQFEKGIFEIKVLRSSLPTQCAKCVQYESWVDKKEQRNLRARLEAESSVQIKAEVARLRDAEKTRLSDQLETEKTRLKADHDAIQAHYISKIEDEKKRLQAEFDAILFRLCAEHEAFKTRLRAEAQDHIKTTESRIKIETESTEARLKAEFDARVKAAEAVFNAEFEAWLKDAEAKADAARLKEEARMNANAQRVARQNANAPNKKAERDLLSQIFPML